MGISEAYLYIIFILYIISLFYILLGVKNWEPTSQLKMIFWEPTSQKLHTFMFFLGTYFPNGKIIIA